MHFSPSVQIGNEFKRQRIQSFAFLFCSVVEISKKKMVPHDLISFPTNYALQNDSHLIVFPITLTLKKKLNRYGLTILAYSYINLFYSVSTTDMTVKD